ncbi:MAG TPA: hypothetical protein VF808_13635 [Ktedonobacterales bacterium]
MLDDGLPVAAPARVVLVALVTRNGRLAMTLGPERPWQDAPGRRLAPLEAPSTPGSGSAGQDAALAAASDALGLALEPATCAWIYGPSARHAMDRVPALASDAPFLRYDRYESSVEPDGTTLPPPSRVLVRAYLARASGVRAPAHNGVVWLPPRALRAVVGGLWMAEFLALDGVQVEEDSALDRSGAEHTLVNTPAQAGERQLLRACAKYGEAILFPPE